MLKKILGYPDYAMDDVSGQLYSIRTGLIRTLTPHVRPEGKAYVELISEDGTRRGFAVTRLLWAVRHNIAPDDIPTGFYIVEVDGELQLLSSQQNQALTMRKMADSSSAGFLDILSRKKTEIELLQRFRRSGDHTELLAYCMTRRDSLCARFSRNESRKLQFCQDLFDNSIELLLALLHRGKCVTDLSNQLNRLMHKQLRDHTRQIRFSDRDKWSEIL